MKSVEFWIKAQEDLNLYRENPLVFPVFDLKQVKIKNHIKSPLANRQIILNHNFVKVETAQLAVIKLNDFGFIGDIVPDDKLDQCLTELNFLILDNVIVFPSFNNDEIDLILNLLRSINNTNCNLLKEEIEYLLKEKCYDSIFWYCYEYLLAAASKDIIEIDDVFVANILKSILFSLNSLKELHEKEEANKKFNKYISDSTLLQTTIKQEINNKVFPEEICSILEKELTKLSSTSPTSPDYSSITSYINTVRSIPYNTYSASKKDPSLILKEINSQHFGLDKVKSNIVEHISLQQWTGRTFGDVICLIGPPGVGKSALCNVIANTLDRKFIKIALGGLSDESEFRGIRRSYLNSEEGRLVKSYIKCGSMDPLVVLDEIDKISPYRGNPADALLEILDPEQNDHFIDRYLGFPVDISRSLFVCTANYKEQIPAPLLDRMSIIEIEGYNRDEQLIIARDYLVPKYIFKWNLPMVHIDEQVIFDLTSKNKTGMREIERSIREILKKTCVHIQKEKMTIDNWVDFTVTNSNLSTIGFTSKTNTNIKPFGF